MVFCQFDHGSGLCSQVWWFDSEGAIECPRPFVSRNRDRIAKLTCEDAYETPTVARKEKFQTSGRPRRRGRRMSEGAFRKESDRLYYGTLGPAPQRKELIQKLA